MKKKKALLLFAFTAALAMTVLCALAETVPVDISTAVIAVEGAPFYYSSREIKPNVTVRLGGEILDPAGYSVHYSSNAEPGWANVRITGNGFAVLDGGGRSVSYAGSADTVFEIRKARLTVHFPASAPGLVYNGSEQGIVWSVSGEAVTGQAGAYIAYSGTDIRPVKAGSYRAAIHITNTNRYELQDDNGFDFFIAPMPLSVIFSGARDFAYNGQIQLPSWQWREQAAGEQPVAHIVITGPHAESRNVGKYIMAVTLADEAVNTNFVLTGPNTFDFAIIPRELTVTPEAGEKRLGTMDPSPVAAYTGSGQAEGEAPVFAGEIDRLAGEAPGQYGIGQGTLQLDPAQSVNANYVWTFQEGMQFSVRELDDTPDAALAPGAPDGENGWYKSQVQIIPPEGYSIGLEQSLSESAWQAALAKEDGVYGQTAYYLRRISDGAISSAKQAPAYKQDGKAPSISSAVVSDVHGNPPGLQITASDHLMLANIVVLEDGAPVHTRNLLGENTQKSTIVYPFDKAGRFNAMAYDAAGNRSMQTAVVEVLDTDGDGLTDHWENWLGTDPDKKDSDGDGVDDRAAYLLGQVTGGRLPAAPALRLNARSGEERGTGISREVWESSLVSAAENVRGEDAKDAPTLGGSAVVVQFDPETGEGWALNGSRLMHFAPNGDAFACDTVFVLQGAFGALRLVVLSSADGSVMLLAHYSETEGQAQGPLKILDTRTGQAADLLGSEGAAFFDLSPDGKKAAFAVSGRVHVVDLQSGAGETVEHHASALTFTQEGTLALGGKGEAALFLREEGKVDSRAYDGPVDTAQRTQTTRRVTVYFPGRGIRTELEGRLTFSEDGRAIVYIGGETGPITVMEAGELH